MASECHSLLRDFLWEGRVFSSVRSCCCEEEAAVGIKYTKQRAIPATIKTRMIPDTTPTTTRMMTVIEPVGGGMMGAAVVSVVIVVVE